MITPLFLGWRICLGMLFDLRLERKFPSWVHAGKQIDVEWKCSNWRNRLAAWSIRVEDQITHSNGSVNERTSVTALLEQVKAGETEYATYRCLFPQRGLYQLGPAQVSTRFPLGLVQGQFCIPDPTDCYVAPVFGRLTQEWERFQSEITGSSAATPGVVGEEDEFYAMRHWRSGDSFRQINWRSTAKQGVPVIKQFDRKCDLDQALLLDLHLPSHQGINLDASEKVERVLSFAATVLGRLRNRVIGHLGVVVCGAELFAVHEKNSNSLIDLVMKHLAVAQGTESTKLAAGLRELFHTVSPGTPLVVISTRPRPSSLTRELKDSSEPGLAELESWVRWIEVDSPACAAMFESETAVSSDSSMKERQP